jgi:hypothetical protein
MPNPSAGSKTKMAVLKNFWTRSIYLNVVKYFWPCSNMKICKVKYYFWPRSKKIERVQKILNTVKTFWAWPKYFWTSRWNRQKIPKYEQLKFPIKVIDKKRLICRQNFIFDLFYPKFQFSVIFGIFFSVFANFYALKSVKQFWIWNMLNNRSKPS